MVFFSDEGAFYPARIERVWALSTAHGPHHSEIHPKVSNSRVEFTGPTSGLATWDMEWNGATVSMKVRFTHARPLGKLQEYLEGPLAGSRMFVYYKPAGDRTEVRVVADLRSPTMSDGELVRAVRHFLQYEFEEDLHYLETALPP